MYVCMHLSLLQPTPFVLARSNEQFPIYQGKEITDQNAVLFQILLTQNRIMSQISDFGLMCKNMSLTWLLVIEYHIII